MGAPCPSGDARTARFVPPPGTHFCYTPVFWDSFFARLRRAVTSHPNFRTLVVAGGAVLAALTLGVCVAYAIILGDTLSSVAVTAGATGALASRHASILACAVALLPLCMLQSLVWLCIHIDLLRASGFVADM